MTEPAWGDWVWDHRNNISAGLSKLWAWLWSRAEFSNPQEEAKPGILVLGPGGVGKSTLGMILSGQYDLLLDFPGAYDESLGLECYPLNNTPGLEMLVPPGQPHRRDATWNDLLEQLSAGKFRGLVYLTAYGYHNHEIGTLTSYKDHRLYRGNKEAFLKAFLQDRRDEELKVLRELGPKVMPPADGKFWWLTLVTKQDLWWDERAQAEQFYSQGDFAVEIQKVRNQHGGRRFRHELALGSLVISNFETGKGELLQPNAAGYDHRHHALSLRGLLEKLEGLRQWEESRERT